mmetsp:Transcript_71846/g.142423  ORF Transcript_71846/g.142423 Transcript_71846/m.142423 type:complete len:227 (+) Transcript_71846:367-1047(+)
MHASLGGASRPWFLLRRDICSTTWAPGASRTWNQTSGTRATWSDRCSFSLRLRPTRMGIPPGDMNSRPDQPPVADGASGAGCVICRLPLGNPLRLPSLASCSPAAPLAVSATISRPLIFSLSFLALRIISAWSVRSASEPPAASSSAGTVAAALSRQSSSWISSSSLCSISALITVEPRRSRRAFLNAASACSSGVPSPLLKTSSVGCPPFSQSSTTTRSSRSSIR